jgi:outer membrane protein OmpA-like peptidoglycan-associated protein
VIGSNSYNQALSQRRADVVKAYLQAKGVNVNGGSEVRGLGESNSQSQCTGQRGDALKACLWRDRRVEVEIVK